MLTFSERTMTVSIDTERCLDCESKACIAACQKYARAILQLKDGVPSVAHLDEEGVKRGGTECLACEFECRMRGRGAIAIAVPIEGLPEYLAKRGLPSSGGGGEAPSGAGGVPRGGGEAPSDAGGAPSSGGEAPRGRRGE